MSEINEEELKQKYEAGNIDMSSLSDEEFDIIKRFARESTRQITSNIYNQIIKLRAEAMAEGNSAVIEKLDEVVSAATDGRKKLRENFSPSSGDESVGIDLYEINKDGKSIYRTTYRSYDECICDLSFYYDVFELENFKNTFLGNENEVNKPYLYRGVCTERYKPGTRTNRYVHYSNSLRALIYKFEEYEKRALNDPETFEFGAEGTAIFLFDKTKKKYVFYVGGHDIHYIDDIIRLADETHKPVPESITDEKERLDVFISHKSEDTETAKKVYDYLMSKGISAFYDEESIPKSGNSEFGSVIDAALDKAQNFILIASKTEYFSERWVYYEWTTFSNDFRNGEKKGNMITIFTDDATAKFEELPKPLRNHMALRLNELYRLINYIAPKAKKE